MNRPVFALLVATFFATPSFAIDGVLEVNQTCAAGPGCFAGDAPGFPVTISSPGAYQLTSSLEVKAVGVNGITIIVEDVTLDLKGFSIRGERTASSTAISGASNKISIENGFIDDWENGISLSGSYARIDHIVLDNVGTVGPPRGGAILAGADCVISDTTVVQTPYRAIETAAGCLIERNNISNGSGGPGTCILTGDRSLVRGNNVHCIEHGIAAGQSTVSENIVSSYFGGIVVSGGVVIGNTVNVPSSAWGIFGSNSLISSNRIRNGGGIGIKCRDCNVVDNVVSDNSGFGLDATGSTGATGYRGNVFNNNNGGNGNPQVLGGIEIGPNVCGGDLTCP